MWYYIKNYNSWSMSVVGGCLLMFATSQALMIIFSFSIMIFVYPIVPLTHAHDFTWKLYIRRAILSVVWLAFTLSGLTLIMFGTIVDQENYDISRISDRLLNMMQWALLDYECVGSRAYLSIALVFLPHMLMTFKILTN